MTTQTMTIAVPIDVYSRLTRKQIKDLLITRLTTVHKFAYYPGKRVNIGIRLEDNIAEQIRVNAALNEVAITEYTASLLHEGEDACLENKQQ